MFEKLEAGNDASSRSSEVTPSVGKGARLADSPDIRMDGERSRPVSGVVMADLAPMS